MPTYRLLRTGSTVPASRRSRQFEAASDRSALIKAREIVRDGTAELWLGDELVCKISG